MISEKEYHSDSEDSGVWTDSKKAEKQQVQADTKQEELRRVGRSEDLYLYSRDEHQWTILLSVAGRVKTGMMVS